MFVTKLEADGTNLIFSTYLGGNGDDEAFRVALDASNNVYLTGTTTSTSFPATTNSPSASVLYSTNSGLVDAFVFKLDASGTNVVYWKIGRASCREGVEMEV